MATHDTHADRAHVPAQAPAHTTVERKHGIVQLWRERSAERKRARLVSARNRRIHATWLRATANRALDTDPLRRRREALLHYRAAAVRTELLELAVRLERAHDPDPECITLLHKLLAGPDSPLYNRHIPAAELHRTLRRIRAGLATHA